MRKPSIGPIVVLCVFVATTFETQADDFDTVLKPLLAQHCIKCHGDQDANGDVDFQSIEHSEQLLTQPELIVRALEAIDTGAMPPETESALTPDTRATSVALLKTMLRQSSGSVTPERLPLQRLNRFQYNNAVRDLFRLNRDVFALPEKLMTRHDDYLHASKDSSPRATLPQTVQVASHSLSPEPGLSDVKPFPKDLRAEHGFDNQADQLTLSPLLLDTFLKLSVSIVESSDFNSETVGIWNEFFLPPDAGADVTQVIRMRLSRFLRLAFRGPVDDETLNRYSTYAIERTNDGLSFTDAMKKVASAALSSPLFLYRSPAVIDQERQLELASRLSFFLWSSCPDDELLTLAENGKLSDPDVLNDTITRMLNDRRIERFLDSFPTQWMQLENVLAATPDPSIYKYFNFDPDASASLQMVLEPLLLFDTVFVEDRSITDFIAPSFGYRSQFLSNWYAGKIQPPMVDRQKIIANNEQNDLQRQAFQTSISSARSDINKLLAPVRERLLQARKLQGQPAPVELHPFAAWSFDGDLKESVRGLDLVAHGEIEFQDGMVKLQSSFLQSLPLPIDLKAKTLEVWFQLDNLDQPGGGLMGIQGPGDFFDTIVIGERKNRHWISGSNNFARTKDFPDSPEEIATNETVQLVMVYTEDGTTTLYRNGRPYGLPFQKGEATFPREQSSVLFGLRHVPGGGNRYLSVRIDQAKLYDRALTAEEVAAAAAGLSAFFSDAELTAALTSSQQEKKLQLTEAIAQTEVALGNVPANIDPNNEQRMATRAFEEDLKQQLRSRDFHRIEIQDSRQGGIITNAAVMSMTSGPTRTHPVARGVWVIEVLFNDPPPPPPNDVPPLNEESLAKDLTIREQFAAHREHSSCAGCHTKLDPLGFALENFDIGGRWRDTYDNGRDVDSGGSLFRKHEFSDVAEFKVSLQSESRRFAKAFTEHMLRFALARELRPSDALAVDKVVTDTQDEGFRLQSIIRQVVLSSSFQQ